MSHSIFPGLVVFLPLGCAVMLSAVTGAWPHSHILSILALFSLSNWGLSPSLQESLQTLPLGQNRTTGFHLLGWAQIYHSIPSPPNMTSSFYFYSLLSVLAEVALSYRLPSLIFLNKTNIKKMVSTLNGVPLNLTLTWTERTTLWPILNTPSLIHGRNFIMDIHFLKNCWAADNSISSN